MATPRARNFRPLILGQEVPVFDQAAQYYGAGIFLSFDRISPLHSRPVPPQSLPTPHARNFRPLILGQEVPVFDQAVQYYGARIFLCLAQ